MVTVKIATVTTVTIQKARGYWVSLRVVTVVSVVTVVYIEYSERNRRIK